MFIENRMHIRQKLNREIRAKSKENSANQSSCIYIVANSGECLVNNLNKEYVLHIM